MTPDATLPCISLWQPWASLLFVGRDDLRKVHETRAYPFPHKYLGTRIAIHAAQRFPPIDQELEEICIVAFGVAYRSKLPRGAVLGSVRVDQWVATEFFSPASAADRIAGDWSDGRFAWRTSDPLSLLEPRCLRGRQGWFKATLPIEHEA